MYESINNESILLQPINRPKSWSLPVSCKVSSRAHFIPEKQMWHTAAVPDLPVYTQEKQQGGFQ